MKIIIGTPGNFHRFLEIAVNNYLDLLTEQSIVTRHELANKGGLCLNNSEIKQLGHINGASAAIKS